VWRLGKAAKPFTERVAIADAWAEMLVPSGREDVKISSYGHEEEDSA